MTAANHSQTFSSLPEGYYYVVVTDANGCVSSTSEQSTFDTSDDCNCIEVGVLSSKLTSGGNDLYYINNDCESGATSINLNGYLAEIGEDENSTIFKFCSKPTLSYMFKYGLTGETFDGPQSGAITVTPFDDPCNSNSDCSKTIKPF